MDKDEGNSMCSVIRLFLRAQKVSGSLEREKQHGPLSAFVSIVFPSLLLVPQALMAFLGVPN